MPNIQDIKQPMKQKIKAKHYLIYPIKWAFSRKSVMLKQHTKSVFLDTGENITKRDTDSDFDAKVDNSL